MKYPQQVSMPSAVSNWLEEQLEARGIDAVVYTRYVLSLLHSHTVDVIYSDEDLHFSPLKKDARRSGGGRKRFRRSSEWWRHAHLDAEQLKRSAAVECLMSASDQNCEIESLVDELCEKLKEIKSEQSEGSASPTVAAAKTEQKPSNPKQVSPQEQAEKYYAAFPPLCRDSAGSPAKLVSLIPKWIQSPKKKPGARKATSRPGIGAKLYHQSHSKIDPGASNMKSRGGGGKQRHNYFARTKKDLGICRNLAKSDTVPNWDTTIFGGNPSACPGKRKASLASPGQASGFVNGGFEPEELLSDQCVEGGSAWHHDEDMNMYDDLPVNIRELLDSPTPPEEYDDSTVEMMNLANMQDKVKGSKRNFISCNIISSIWSNDQSMDDVSFDNRYNAARDSSGLLDHQFSSITIDSKRERGPNQCWPVFDGLPSAQNEVNNYFESRKRFNTGGGSFLEGFHSLPPAWSNDADSLDEECFENEHLLNRVAVSLMKINHNKEKSCFAEIVPTGKKVPAPLHQSFNPFSLSNSMFSVSGSRLSNAFDTKEDLLTSETSHFRPINEKVEASRTQGQYADGATFVISNNLDKVNYKRSDSGSMYLETEYGQSKKYCEYYLEETASDEKCEFVLKFSICQNDKGCQTDDELTTNCGSGPESIDSICTSASAEDPREDIERECTNAATEELKICTCPLTNNNSATTMDYSTTVSDTEATTCAVHPDRPESMMSEIMWRYDSKSCDKCNNNTLTWNADWLRNAQVGPEWDSQSLRNIWKGGEVCHACQSSTTGGGRPPPDSQHSQLREDISLDGEQLLSDLSSLQKCYRDDLPLAAEVTCDFTDFFVPKERKRRHSYITAHVPDPCANNRSSWSFASRLEEDCLIQMSTMPTLRSVTL